MQYRFERTGDAALFILEGRIDSPGAIELDAAVRERLVPGDRAVIIDMAGVSYMSSAGIRVLSVLEKGLRQGGGRLYLCALQPAVLRVLGITGFDRVFPLCATRAEALRRCRLEKGLAETAGETILFTGAHTCLSAETFPDREAVLRITGSGEKAGAGIPGPEDLSPRPFGPDEYSLGTGAPGESAAGSYPERGLILTTGNAIFWKPFSGPDPPDFLIPRPDAPRILLHTLFSAAADDRFHEVIAAMPVRPEGFSLAGLCSDLFRHARAARHDCPPVVSMVMYAGTRGAAGTPVAGTLENGDGKSPLFRDRTLVSFGICIDTGSDLSAYDRDALGALPGMNVPESGGNGLFLYQHGLVFDAAPAFTSREINRLVSETVVQEPCIGLAQLSPDTMLTRAVIGISYISGIVRTDRMPVRIAGECPGWNRTYETIARWLHPECRELALTPLSGGFSGTLVFRVSARDARGRLMMPLVMKLGAWPPIEAEIRGYTGHVKRYIQNNATQIIDTERIGEYGGILYNFVGIRGAESRISSLEDFYLSHTADEILPVLDALFRVVLSGWYGEPEKKEMPLYREYNTFWQYDQTRAYAASHFGAAPDMKEIGLPFGLGTSVNPLFFIEKVMPGRLSRLFPVYRSSVHGDLNMRNVLLDGEKNLWLIDFSETRYSHILRDIVKLEAVIKGEMVPVGSREALAELVRTDVPFLSARALSEIPKVPATVSDPALEKAFRCVRRLREHAGQIAPGDDDITQYYLGLLPFTLNLLSYWSVNEYQKEYGWIASSLICRRLLDEGP
ncbi:MAG: anti-sigma factor antagonist [Methanoregula sp.]|nr:anti-sigma factor antagonist [Methanoregula sp.]